MKIGPNERCPCGSGGKYKKCCGAPGKRPSTLFTPADRQNALRKLHDFADEVIGDEARSELFDAFFLDAPPAADDDEDFVGTSFFAHQLWVFFDTANEAGVTLAQMALAERGLFTSGESNFVKAAHDVRQRLYEVVSTVPGESVVLRDMLRDTTVEVFERTASRTLRQWDVIATRVFPVGSSGRPEMDGGLFAFPRSRRESVLEELRELVEGASGAELDEIERDDFAPLFFELWRMPMPLPQLLNQDGHELCDTRVVFDARSPKRLEGLLDAAPLLQRHDGAARWSWSTRGPEQADSILRGTIERKAKRLVLTTNSRERAAEGRRLIEETLGDLVTCRVTETSDTRSAVERELRGARAGSVGREPPSGIPAHLMAQLAPQLEAMMKSHYARWVDEPVPMLDGLTPRQAAKGLLRPRVVEALKDLESMYQRAKDDGQPGFDPKDLWTELGIERPGA